MIYLDNAATTPTFSEVLEAMLPWFQPERVGNPGSIHTQGVKARNAVEKARKQVARMIGAEPSEIFSLLVEQSPTTHGCNVLKTELCRGQLS